MGKLGFKHTKETKAKISAAQMGERNHMYGKHLSNETRTKLSAALKGERNPMFGKHRYTSKESKAKISIALKKRCQEPEYRAKLSANAKALWQDPEYRARQVACRQTDEFKAKLSSATYKGEDNPRFGKPLPEITRTKISVANKGKRRTEETLEKMSAITKARWQNPKFSEKMRKARNIKPNKAELKLQDILNRHFPSEWRFVGDGQVNLGGQWPDFINVNGKKEVIELFGAYWHPIFDIAEKKEHYRQYGFRVAIIWEDELKNEERLIKIFRRKFR